MNELMHTLFEPLDGGYCNYFYYLSVFFFAVFAFSTVTVLLKVVKRKTPSLVSVLTLLSQPLLLYFINRLQYSMCARALN